MKLGPKKRERLDGAAFAAFCGVAMVPADRLDCWRTCIAAVVDLLLSRQESQVAPLLEALRYCVNRMSDHGIHGAAEWGERALAAYEAAQADEPEPVKPVTLAEAVEAILVEPTSLSIPEASECYIVKKSHIDAIRAALAREKGGQS